MSDAAQPQDVVYVYKGVALPERIAVDAAGTYWRDFGPYLSLVPHKDGNEGANIVAEYRLVVTSGMKKEVRNAE